MSVHACPVTLTAIQLAYMYPINPTFVLNDAVQLRDEKRGANHHVDGHEFCAEPGCGDSLLLVGSL
jgi:hypothetical protein